MSFERIPEGDSPESPKESPDTQKKKSNVIYREWNVKPPSEKSADIPSSKKAEVIDLAEQRKAREQIKESKKTESILLTEEVEGAEEAEEIEPPSFSDNEYFRRCDACDGTGKRFFLLKCPVCDGKKIIPT